MNVRFHFTSKINTDTDFKFQKLLFAIFLYFSTEIFRDLYLIAVLSNPTTIITTGIYIRNYIHHFPSFM